MLFPLMPTRAWRASDARLDCFATTDSPVVIRLRALGVVGLPCSPCYVEQTIRILLSDHLNVLCGRPPPPLIPLSTFAIFQVYHLYCVTPKLTEVRTQKNTAAASC